jgi:hypothetical protein
MTDGTIVTTASRKHVTEWPFWCLLATRTLATAESDLWAALDRLTARAAALSLPCQYESGKGSLWAAACRIYLLSRMNAKDSGKIGYIHMIFGIGRAFRSPRFAKIAFTHVNRQVLSPAFDGRTFRESVADAFLLNAAGPPPGVHPRLFDKKALSSGLHDTEMLAAAVKAVSPPDTLWDATVQEYYQRRAGYLRTMFSSAKRWRADLQETSEGKRAAERQ